MYSRLLNPPRIQTVQTFVFTQATPLQTWDIIHNLNRPVQVRLLDSNNSDMIAEILEISDNQIQVRFGGPETGRAYLL